MIGNLGQNRILWLLTASMALIVSGIGISYPSIYARVVDASLLPGTFSQDIVTFAAALVVLILAMVIKRGDVKKMVIILGLLGYFFYSYGIFVIERVYNIFYLIYLAVFASAFWSLIYATASIGREILQNVRLMALVRYISAGGAFLQPLIFYPMWISALIPLMKTGQKIENLYSIYILDLCFIMPAFIILAVMNIRRQNLGLLLMPALFILGFTLILSVTAGEIIKPFFNMTANMAALSSSGLLASFFLLLGVIHLVKLKIKTK